MIAGCMKKWSSRLNWTLYSVDDMMLVWKVKRRMKTSPGFEVHMYYPFFFLLLWWDGWMNVAFFLSLWCLPHTRRDLFSFQKAVMM